VRERVSKAEIFTPEYGQDTEERMRSLQALRVIARGRRWLADRQRRST